MKTQLFKARDMKTAMNLVNDEYGDKAIIYLQKEIMVLLKLKRQTMIK